MIRFLTILGVSFSLASVCVSTAYAQSYVSAPTGEDVEIEGMRLGLEREVYLNNARIESLEARLDTLRAEFQTMSEEMDDLPRVRVETQTQTIEVCGSPGSGPVHEGP